MSFGEFVTVLSAMEFWDIVRVLGGLAILAAIIGFAVWGLVLQFIELVGMFQGFHDLEMAYLVSREDMEKLTKKEWRKTRRMEHAELKAYLHERFPNSTPALTSDV